MTALVAPVAFVLLTAGEASYQSEALLLVATPSAAEGVLDQSPPYQEPERLVATEVEVVEGRAVAESTADRLRGQGWQVTATDVSEQVEAAPRGFSSAIEVVGTASQPARARQLTTAVVRAYVRYRAGLRQSELERLESQLTERLAAAEAELAELDGATTRSSTRATAVGQVETVAGWLEEVRLLQSVDTSGVEVVSPASTPDAPAGALSPAAAVLLALAGGLLTGCGIAFVIDLVRDAVRTPQEIAALTPAPILVELPRPSGGQRDVLDVLADPTHPLSSAGRALRVRLESLADHAAPASVLMIGAEDDATDVLAGGVALAASCGRAGLRVMLVADVAVDQTLPGFDRSHDGEIPQVRSTAFANVWSTRATTQPDGSAGLLDAYQSKNVLEALVQNYDVVVIVMPATADVVEAVALGRLVEAVVVVPVLDRTPGRYLQQLITTLGNGGVTIAGLVVSRVVRGRTQRRRGRRGSTTPATRAETAARG